MKIKKFNESISTFTYETFDFFDLIVEKLKKNKGYTIFSIEKEEDFCKVFNFETKEEFDKEFTITKHPIYPGNIIAPNNVIESEIGLSDTCIINGQEFILNINELYLMVDGKII